MNALPEHNVVAGRVVTPEGVLDGWVRTSGGLIAEVGSGQPPNEVQNTGEWVVPGFVDIHCHGGGGGSFSSADPAQWQRACELHRSHGTTTMLASLVSAPVDQLVNQLSALREAVAEGMLAGIHLEGPFLSAARCGAHDPALLRVPDRASIAALLRAGRGSVRMLTLAPELENAVDTVERLTAQGVVAALGHTDAESGQVRPAIEAGATVATHLFNGMRPFHHREPGAVGALLDDERVTVELICDLVHAHPDAVRLAARLAGPTRTAAITDAISATGAGDDTYLLGALPVRVVDGVPRSQDGSLAGSTLTMDVAFRNLVTRCGLTVAGAVAATSTCPASVLGLSGRIGAIAPGFAADLVVLDADLRVRDVMMRGSWVEGSQL